MRKKERAKLNILIMAVIVTSVVAFNLKSTISKDEKSVIQGIEVVLDDEIILDMADAIVKGTNVKMVDHMDYQAEDISATVYIYSLDVIDSFYGDYVAGDTMYFSYGGTILPSGIESDTNMILFFKDNTLDYNSNDLYSFVSLSQGVYYETDMASSVVYDLREDEEKQMINRLGKVFDAEWIRSKYEKN